MNAFEIITKHRDPNRACIWRLVSSSHSRGFVVLLRHSDLGDEASMALALSQADDVMQVMLGAVAAEQLTTALLQAHITAEQQGTQFSAVVGMARHDSHSVELHSVGDACVMSRMNGSNRGAIVIYPELEDYGTGVYNVLSRALGTPAFKPERQQSTARVNADSELNLSIGMFLPGTDLMDRLSAQQALPPGFLFAVRSIMGRE